MQLPEQRISWSSSGAAVVRDVGELDILLDKLEIEHGPENLGVVLIDGPAGRRVRFGIGGDKSFVNSAETPYFTTIGDVTADGDAEYVFQGQLSLVPRSQLISRELARKIVREFFATGELPSCQTWKPKRPA